MSDKIVIVFSDIAHPSRVSLIYISVISRIPDKSMTDLFLDPM